MSDEYFEERYDGLSDLMDLLITQKYMIDSKRFSRMNDAINEATFLLAREQEISPCVFDDDGVYCRLCYERLCQKEDLDKGEYREFTFCPGCGHRLDWGGVHEDNSSRVL